MDIFLMALGLAGLYFGGEYLVKGSVALSLRYGLSQMVVGLTVMAFGTSAPELMVSLRSALTGHGDIAFGNVVGSNIANVLLILGVPAIMSPIRTDKIDSRRPWSEMMFSGILFYILIHFDPFGFEQGAILLLAFVVILGAQLWRARQGKMDNAVEVDVTNKDEALGRILFWILIGIVLLPFGADLLVRGAVNIARDFGISEAVIGLTIVAIGTSLPELAASIAAASEGRTEMAVGNVIGSCLFNTLLIIGVTGVFSQSHLDPKLISFDTPVMLLCYAGMALFVFWKRPISRFAGVVFVGAYFLYMFLQLA